MRPVSLFWLQLLAAARAVTAGEASTTDTAASTAIAPEPVPATPNAVLSSHPLASLFFPNAGLDQQMRAAFDGGAGGGAQAHTVPWLASLARSFPSSLRAFDRQPAQSREAVSAIEEFTGPLVRFATGGQPVAADVEQLIDSIPHLARSANVLKDTTDKINLATLDISSLPSNIISHVLNGGEIPGIDRAELDRVVREHLKRMSDTADRLMKGEIVENIEKILPPLDRVPKEMVMSSLQGKSLPGLTADETTKIREYYTKQLPSHSPTDTETASPLPESLSALGNMVRLLPPGYDVGKVPAEFIRSILEGRVPDLSLLPADLQLYMNGRKDEALMLVKSLNSSVTEIVQHLQATLQKMPEVQRASAYDISQVTHEVIDEEATRERQSRNVLYTITWVAIAFAIATVVTVWLLYKKFTDPSRKTQPSAPTPPAREPRVDASPSRVVRVMDSAASPRLRYVASFDSHEAKVEFAAKASRFSTPKPQLVLNSPEIEKKDEKKTDGMSIVTSDEAINKDQPVEDVDSGKIDPCKELDVSEDDNDVIYDDTIQ